MPATAVRLYFASGRSSLRLSKVSAAALRTIARDARSITLCGSADSVGSRAANLRLARQRIGSARALLLRYGVPADSIRVDEAATMKLSADSGALQGAASDRRVELFIVGGGERVASH